jgi:hypothetical protein
MVNRRSASPIFLFLMLAAAPSAVAQEPMIIPRLSGPVVLDGRIDEPAWQAIEPLPMVMHTPVFGEPPTDPTEIRIAYDDDYIYVAARCYVHRPEDIFATTLRRDHLAPTTDYVIIALDTFNDNENGLVFSVMPTGARVDYTVANDAVGAGPVNTSWNAFWDAAVTRTDEGWFAEMRIPFSSLRFQDDHGRVTMGLTATRWIARNTSVAVFPAIPPEWGFWSFIKPSQARKVVFENVFSRKPLYVTPYALAGLGQEFRLNGARTAYQRVDDPAYNLGLDLKYGLTSNLTLDLTLNTDFAQVEADDQQVNLTRFSLFFPEKRMFFQERASIFEFGALEPSSLFDFNPFPNNRLFYSRRIGLHEGRPVRLLGGARVVGRIGDWDVGLLDMQTAREPGLLPGDEALASENFGILRLRRQVFNPYSYAGGILAGRIGIDGRYNIVYGFDGIFRPFGDDYISLNWAQTFEDAAGYGFTALDNTRLQVKWQRQRFDGFGYDMSFSRSGAAYHPAMGFALRQDYTRIGDRFFYGWFPGERSRLQRHQLYLNSAIFLRNDDGSVETIEFGPSWEGTLKSGDMFQVKAFMFSENLRRPFRLSSTAGVPAGDYTFYDLGAHYRVLAGKRSGTLSATAGLFYDGHRFTAGAAPNWILSRYVQLQGYYGLARIRFPERNEQFDAHVGRIKVDVALNTMVSAAAFIQYNSAAEAVSANVRLRYNPREGNDFYLVYNEGLNTNRYRSDPFLPFTSSRVVLAKYTYTFLF